MLQLFLLSLLNPSAQAQSIQAQVEDSTVTLDVRSKSAPEINADLNGHSVLTNLKELPQPEGHSVVIVDPSGYSKLEAEHLISYAKMLADTASATHPVVLWIAGSEPEYLGTLTDPAEFPEQALRKRFKGGAPTTAFYDTTLEAIKTLETTGPVITYWLGDAQESSSRHGLDALKEKIEKNPKFSLIVLYQESSKNPGILRRPGAGLMAAQELADVSGGVLEQGVPDLTALLKTVAAQRHSYTAELSEHRAGKLVVTVKVDGKTLKSEEEVGDTRGQVTRLRDWVHDNKMSLTAFFLGLASVAGFIFYRPQRDPTLPPLDDRLSGMSLVFRGKRHPICRHGIVINGGKKDRISITRDGLMVVSAAGVSDPHAMLTVFEDGSFVIRDRNTAFGTYVDDAQVNGTLRLTPEQLPVSVRLGQAVAFDLVKD